MKTLVAGVGYHNLRDMSLGPVLNQRLSGLDWPEGIDVDSDLSFGPLSVVYRFQAMPEPYKRIVLFAAVQRGRPPGTVCVSPWAGQLPPADEIQARVGEAVTGVVSLDNLLVIGQYFGIWPEDLIVIEVEPQDDNWGEGFSPEIEAVLEQVTQTIRQAALEGLPVLSIPLEANP